MSRPLHCAGLRQLLFATEAAAIVRHTPMGKVIGIGESERERERERPSGGDNQTDKH
jgi:hypothetical protein